MGSRGRRGARAGGGLEAAVRHGVCGGRCSRRRSEGVFRNFAAAAFLKGKKKKLFYEKWIFYFFFLNGG